MGKKLAARLALTFLLIATPALAGPSLSIRGISDGNRTTVAYAISADGSTVVMEGTAVPAFVALAVAADEPCPAHVSGQTYELRRTLRVPAAGREQCAFFIACAPERA